MDSSYLTSVARSVESNCHRRRCWARWCRGKALGAVEVVEPLEAHATTGVLSEAMSIVVCTCCCLAGRTLPVIIAASSKSLLVKTPVRLSVVIKCCCKDCGNGMRQRTFSVGVIQKPPNP